MLTESQIAQYHRDGFLLGPRILTDSQVNHLNSEVTRIIETRNDPRASKPLLLRNLGPSDKNPVWQIVNIWQASPPFAQLITDKTIAEDLAQLTNATELRLFHDQIQYKPPSTGGINMWHQDLPYWPILTGGQQITAWLALDDADQQNGCMSMVPGSHHWGNHIALLESLPTFDAMPAYFDNHPIETKSCPVPAGHVHYHHSLTWHGSPANRSGRPRRAIALHFMTEGTLFRAGGNHPMKPFVTSLDGQPLTGKIFPLIRPR